MTFALWWDKFPAASSERNTAKAAWDAALQESGTQELYEACRALLLQEYGDLEHPELSKHGLFYKSRAAIAKYESSFQGSKP